MKKTKSQKQLQIGENYKREMSQIFMQDDMLNFKNCHITILEADVSPDLKNIKFYLDIFGEESFQIKVVKYLNGLDSYLRNKISGKVKSRLVPQMRFILDDSGKKAARIEQLLNNEAAKEFDKKDSGKNV